MMARALQSLVFVGIFAFLPGSSLFGIGGSSGNAEGYTGVRAVPQDAELRDLSATLYYWMEPEYKCTTTDGQQIKSYRGAVQVGAAGFVYYGDYCTKEPITTDVLSKLVIHGTLLGYAGGIFQKEIK